MSGVTPEREQEVAKLGCLLQQVVAQFAGCPDPIVAAALCIQHEKTGLSMVSVEATPSTTVLMGMAFTMLGGVAERERDPVVARHLREAAVQVQKAIARVTQIPQGATLN